VSNQTGSHDPSTNGVRAPAGTNGQGLFEGAASSFDGEAIDERLDALLRTIRSWDWRTASLEASSAGAHASAATVFSQTTAVSQEPLADPTVLPDSAIPVHDATEPPTVVLNPMPPHPGVEQPPPPDDSETRSAGAPEGAGSVSGPEALSQSSTPATTIETSPSLDDEDVPGGPHTTPTQDGERSGPVTSEPSLVRSSTDTQPVELEPMPTAPTPTLEPNPTRDQGTAVGDSASWLEFEYGPEPKPEPDRPNGRLTSRSRLKVFGFVALGLILAAALAFGGIALFDKSPTSSGRTQTTHNPPPARATHPGHPASPITAAQLTQYEGYAQGLQTANLAATHGFDRTGATPTPSQLVLVDVAYGAALNTYNNELGSITWPTSMQSAVEADHAQLLALMSFLRSFSIVQASGETAWLVQLHNRTSTAQTADNQVRGDLGLARSVSFP
jgi:hypothetical protein